MEAGGRPGRRDAKLYGVKTRHAPPKALAGGGGDEPTSGEWRAGSALSHTGRKKKAPRPGFGAAAGQFKGKAPVEY
jgi:hypothetical protein